jgi:hypothetical protein
LDDTDTKTVVGGSSGAYASGQVRWPYRYGEIDNAYLHVNPMDSGADPYEVVQQAVAKFDYSYPFNYFRRQRRDWNYWDLPERTTQSYFERLRTYHWIADFNTANLSSVLQGRFDTLKNTDDNIRSNLIASTMMLDGLNRALLVPQTGNFGLADPKFQLGTSGRLYDFLENGGSALFSLDASNSRFIDVEYDSTPQGGGSWDYLTWTKHAGFDVEKLMAALALTDGRPTLEIVRRDTWLDGRDLYVNFRTDLAKGVDRLLGGLLAEDWDTVAPYLPNLTSDPAYLSLSDAAPTRPSKPLLLYPNFGYQQQLGSLIFAEVFSRLGTDLTLQNKTLVYLEGTENVLDFPDAQKIKFTDPRSGFTYVARLYGPDTIDGKVVDQGIASRMIAHANALLAGAYQVQVDAAGNPVPDAFGRPTLLLDANGQPIPTTDATKAKAFTDYVGLVDAAVQIARLLGHGPL